MSPESLHLAGDGDRHWDFLLGLQYLVQGQSATPEEMNQLPTDMHPQVVKI